MPEHRDFIYDRLKPFCENELGVSFQILHGTKTYEDVFHHIIVRGPHEGQKRGFVFPGICNVNRDCKLVPMRKFNRTLAPNTISYIGIAADEETRLARLDGERKISLLDKYGVSEMDARKLCAEHNLLSPIYNLCRRNGCWFCPNASDAELLHIIKNHPHYFDRLIEWEREENVFHRRLSRRETPSEIKARLIAKSQAGLSIPKI